MRGYEWYEIQDNIAYWKEFELPKIIYPNICSRNEFAWDDAGVYANQKTFIITGSNKHLLAILNSNVVLWLFHRLIPKLQNGFFEPGSKFLSPFPIAPYDDGQASKLEFLVSTIEYLNTLEETQTERDVLMLGYFEQLLNGLVYELYFPDDLHAAGLWFFDLVNAANLPEFDKQRNSKRLETLRQFFETIYHQNHPIRIADGKLQTLDTVRIIEGNT